MSAPAYELRIAAHDRQPVHHVSLTRSRLYSRAIPGPASGRCFCADGDEGAGGCSPWARDRSFVDKHHSASARAAIRGHKDFAFTTLAPASGRHAIGTNNPNRAFTRRCRGTGGALRTLRAGRSRRAGRSSRSDLALFTCRPRWPGLALRAIASHHADGQRDSGYKTFHAHARPLDRRSGRIRMPPLDLC
jgi:hypothetical protein